MWAARARPSLERARARLGVLAAPWLYRPGTDPQRIVDVLRDGPARYDIEAILRVAHGVRFPPMWQRDLPNIYEILDGRATVEEMQEAQAARQAAEERRQRDSELRHMDEIVRLAEFLAPGQTLHLPTLNRRLKGFAPRLRCTRTTSSGRPVAVLEGFDSHWRFFGPSGRRDPVAAVVDELRRVASAIHAAGGPDHVAHIWELRRDYH